PEVEPEPEPEPEIEPEPEPEAIVLPKPKPKPEPKPEPKPKPKPVPKPKPKPKPAPKPVPEVEQKADAPPFVASGQGDKAEVPKGPSGPVDPDRPRVVGRVDYMGKRPTPQYPRASERMREQGRVVLRVLISPQGEVSDVKVQSSSGHKRLDNSAIKAVKQARFKPYTENGIAYPAMADIPFDFVL